MIKVEDLNNQNTVEITPTMFPDGTKLIKFNPTEYGAYEITWLYDSDDELFQLIALTKHIKEFGDGPGEQGLSGARAAHHDDVALLYLHPVGVVGLLQSLVVVVYSNGEESLGFLLPDDILVEIVFYLLRLGHLLEFELLF